MIRDILVHVDGGEAGRQRARFAVDLAVRTGARLTGLHVTPPAEVPPMYKPSHVAQVAAVNSAKLVLDVPVAAAVFREEIMSRLPDAHWFEAKEKEVAKGIADHARYADIVIVGQNERQGSPEAHPLPVAHSLVVQCGRPVLVVPPSVQPGAFARVAVAWDGSREAVRAVHDALPLLRLSQSAEIVTVVSPSAEVGEVDVKRFSEHLANHGIAVGSNVVRVRSAEEHDSLELQIEQGNYDLLVMGAYSYPRWVEFIFGGATQSILLSSKIPVLVSH
jgi:nucleotide-binding universal stress UspA family protein